MTRKSERAAWTTYITGAAVATPSKYCNERTGKYASGKEAQVAANLRALEIAGQIADLREQVNFVLVEGKDGILPIRYVADFTWLENGKLHIGDAKGYNKNRVYLLKKKLMKLLLGLDIQEL